jgi:hypothetical protein
MPPIPDADPAWTDADLLQVLRRPRHTATRRTNAHESAAIRSVLPMRVRLRRGIGVLLVVGQEVVDSSGYRVIHG